MSNLLIFKPMKQFFFLLLLFFGLVATSSKSFKSASCDENMKFLTENFKEFAKCHRQCFQTNLELIRVEECFVNAAMAAIDGKIDSAEIYLNRGNAHSQKANVLHEKIKKETDAILEAQINFLKEVNQK